MIRAGFMAHLRMENASKSQSKAKESILRILLHRLELNIIKNQIDLFLKLLLRNYSVSHLDTLKNKPLKILNGSLKQLKEEGKKYFLLQNHHN